MAQLSITSSTPADGDTDVFVNNPIDVVFDAAVLESSVSNTSVVLTDRSTENIVDSEVERITTTTIRITPIGVLAEDTVYRVSFPGTDIALGEDYVIKDSGGEALTTTLTVTFRTGSRVYIDDTAVDKDATDLSLEGDLNLPTHVKALGEFVVESTSPRNHSADVALDLGGNNQINITFDNNLSSGDFTSSWAEVNVFPLLDDTTWLGTGNSFGGTIPGYSVSVSTTDLVVAFSGDLPKNVGVQVELDQAITDENGNEFGPNSYIYSITTERWPSIAGVNVLKREIKAATDELHDDYLAAVLFAKTVEFVEKFTTSATPHMSVHKWVLNSAIVDILDDKELEKALAAGTRRQLGDLNVSVDPVIGKLSLKHARALKKIDEAAKTLLKESLVAKRYTNYNYEDVTRVYRLWYGVSHKLLDVRFITYQGEYAGANTTLNRQAKIPPGADWW
jgi:hypothetical protein